jgi:UV DNA damage endonuclease
MKLGYPCINNTIGCTPNKTFRLASYCSSRLVESIKNNLLCLQKILEYNVAYNLLFFRISSDLVPFASHKICDLDWPRFFKSRFQELGQYIKQHNIRISMHPDQFVLLNSPQAHVTHNSIQELLYHARVLDALELDTTAKIQIHAGGIYGNKPAALERFIHTYNQLDTQIKQRLVLENDDRLYSAQDCLYIYQQTGIPIIFDTLHHECLNNGESLETILPQIFATWKTSDGVPMVDYSSQAPESRKGKHVATLNKAHFTQFIEQTRKYNFDIMLEIKDKEKSALQAIAIAQRLRSTAL